MKYLWVQGHTVQLTLKLQKYTHTQNDKANGAKAIDESGWMLHGVPCTIFATFL